MINFQFNPVDPRDPVAGREYRGGCATASLTELTWYYFHGDVHIGTADGEFTTNFGWVAILDFATNLSALASNLQVGEQANYWFKESDDWFSFLRTGSDQVVIAASFAPGLATSSYGEFKAESANFLAQILKRLIAEFPELALNPVLGRIRPS